MLAAWFTKYLIDHDWSIPSQFAGALIRRNLPVGRDLDPAPPDDLRAAGLKLKGGVSSPEAPPSHMVTMSPHRLDHSHFS